MLLYLYCMNLFIADLLQICCSILQTENKNKVIVMSDLSMMSEYISYIPIKCKLQNKYINRILK